MLTLNQLLGCFPYSGELVWIGLRPARTAPMVAVEEVLAEAGAGLQGDRYHAGGRRQVTLLQWEHLPAIGAFSRTAVTPELLRRNLIISGLNLLALKGCTFQIGESIMQASGLCQPCSRMEAILGPGGYNAMRGHGGLTAQIIRSGRLRVGDPVTVLASNRNG